MIRSIVLGDEAAARLETQLKKNIQNMDVKNNYGDIIHSSSLSELTIKSISETNNAIQIEFEHNDPAIHTPVNISITKNCIRYLLDDVVVESLVVAGVAL